MDMTQYQTKRPLQSSEHIAYLRGLLESKAVSQRKDLAARGASLLAWVRPYRVEPATRSTAQAHLQLQNRTNTVHHCDFTTPLPTFQPPVQQERLTGNFNTRQYVVECVCGDMSHME